MRWIQAKDYDHLSELSAQIFEEQIKEKPNSILGLATGSTPIGLYKKLIERYKKGIISFKEVKTFNLDEYIGLAPEDKHSYHYFMFEQLFNHIDINPENVYIPSGLGDIDKNIMEYEKLIDEVGGIDLQLLGIGVNGHIGFNEPGTSFHSKTHVVQLEESTIKANQRFFDKIEDVPTKAITIGIETILKAKKILLLISGESKQKAFERLKSGEVTEDFPASVLHNHPNVTVIYEGVK